MTTFEQYLENLMGMKKAEIINEGITWASGRTPRATKPS